jgi:hypothetical protein
MNRQWKTKAAYALLVSSLPLPLRSITVTFSLTNGGTTPIKHSLTMCQILDIAVRDMAARGLVPANASAHTLQHTFAYNYLAEFPGIWLGSRRF